MENGYQSYLQRPWWEGGSIDKSEGKCYHLLEKYKETCATTIEFKLACAVFVHEQLHSFIPESSLIH